MAVLAVVPARLGSTRLSRKPLRLLGGLPLVVRVYQRVVALGIADRCIVATDHDEILATCAAHGVPAMLTATSHPSGTDRVAEVARALDVGHGDIVLNVQGDEPFVAHDALAGAVAVVQAGRAPIGTAAVAAPLQALHDPDVVKVLCTDEGRALYFSRAPVPWLRDADDADARARLAPLVRQHVGVYAYTPEALRTWVALPPHPLELVERLEQLRPLAHGVALGVAHAAAAEGGIDTEADLERANERWTTIASPTSSHGP